MEIENPALLALILMIVTSAILLFRVNWRVSITALGVQYVGVFGMVTLSWPLEMAAIKLVAGWIAAAVLGMELVHTRPEVLNEPKHRVSEYLFKGMLAGLLLVLTLSLGPDLARLMLNASYEQILGSIWLMGIGVLQLGVSDRPLRVMIGLLTFLSGFEILYCTLNPSVLVAGLLSVITLGVSLTGTYLIGLASTEVQE